MSEVAKLNFDAIVVGGGLIGLSIGYGLSRLGLSVLLLDAEDTAIRAARGNFGLVWPVGVGRVRPVANQIAGVISGHL